MTVGSILAAVSLMLCSLSPNALMFAGALTIIEIAANLVQYGAAFALLVQLAPNVAQRSITYLTLITGFASTIFWPITTTLQHWLTATDLFAVRLPPFVSLRAGTPFARAVYCKEWSETINE